MMHPEKFVALRGARDTVALRDGLQHFFGKIFLPDHLAETQHDGLFEHVLKPSSDRKPFGVREKFRGPPMFPDSDPFTPECARPL